jgi:hypothetical protein
MLSWLKNNGFSNTSTGPVTFQGQISSFFPFLEILKDPAFAKIAIIHYTTMNYRNQAHGKLKVE